MPANADQLTTVLTVKPIPPPASLTESSTGGIVVMVTVSKEELLHKLELIGDNLKAALNYLQLSSTFRAETRIARAQERLDKLVLAITDQDHAGHDELCRRAPGNTGR